jgi:hypothetical protein
VEDAAPASRRIKLYDEMTRGTTPYTRWFRTPRGQVIGREPGERVPHGAVEVEVFMSQPGEDDGGQGIISRDVPLPVAAQRPACSEGILPKPRSRRRRAPRRAGGSRAAPEDGDGDGDPPAVTASGVVSPLEEAVAPAAAQAVDAPEGAVPEGQQIADAGIAAVAESTGGTHDARSTDDAGRGGGLAAVAASHGLHVGSVRSIALRPDRRSLALRPARCRVVVARTARGSRRGGFSA